MDFLSLFGDQSGPFNQFYQQMMNQSNKYQPWIDRGNAAGEKAMGEYNWLTDNPNGLQDEIAAGYETSPYQKYLLNNTQTMINNNAANTGMITNPAIQAMLGNELNTQTGQFMNQYIDRGMNSYGQGLAGLGQANQLGLGALDNQSNLVEAAAGGQLKGGQSRQGAWANLFGTAAGAGVTAATGMPMMGTMGGGQQQPQQSMNAFGASGVPWAPTNNGSSGYSTFNWGGMQ